MSILARNCGGESCKILRAPKLERDAKAVPRGLASLSLTVYKPAWCLVGASACNARETRAIMVFTFSSFARLSLAESGAIA